MNAIDREIKMQSSTRNVKKKKMLIKSVKQLSGTIDVALMNNHGLSFTLSHYMFLYYQSREIFSHL